ncbi:MAG: 1-(5-phosphoribosyl)-5-amino-4-imidazole-carboxylate carboxylase [Candidatus Melainabacteria bacterium]|nr:MAG: 1-(5-phosphoribosyl)-5-amino-4-imidazole-carboxylate carboxylase [Candidatus Melainabacteria bacterium]
MDRERILSLLMALSQGKVTTSEVYEELKELPFKDLQFARLDSHRSLRQGAPEVIYCPGKTVEQIIAIATQLKNGHKIVVGTKAEEKVGRMIEESMPDSKYHLQARMLIWGELPESPADNPRVGIISAGTADGPVAEEAYLYLAASAVATERISDVGVAGLHRLLDVLNVLRRCDVLIVIAGMDGVLPSVVGGLVEAPVIAVPTSVGYGANFEGLSALLTMLNSCAAGLTVVNIDNGFGAAAAALRILSTIKSAKPASSLPVK